MRVSAVAVEVPSLGHRVCLATLLGKWANCRRVAGRSRCCGIHRSVFLRQKCAGQAQDVFGPQCRLPVFVQAVFNPKFDVELVTQNPAEYPKHLRIALGLGEREVPFGGPDAHIQVFFEGSMPIRVERNNLISPWLPRIEFFS